MENGPGTDPNRVACLPSQGTSGQTGAIHDADDIFSTSLHNSTLKIAYSTANI